MWGHLGNKSFLKPSVRSCPWVGLAALAHFGVHFGAQNLIIFGFFGGVNFGPLFGLLLGQFGGQF